MKRRFIIKIDLETKAFKPTETVETARILNELALHLHLNQNFSDEDYFMLYDQDGRTCGGAEIEKVGRASLRGG